MQGRTFTVPVRRDLLGVASLVVAGASASAAAATALRAHVSLGTLLPFPQAVHKNHALPAGFEVNHVGFSADPARPRLNAEPLLPVLGPQATAYQVRRSKVPVTKPSLSHTVVSCRETRGSTSCRNGATLCAYGRSSSAKVYSSRSIPHGPAQDEGASGEEEEVCACGRGVRCRRLRSAWLTWGSWRSCVSM